MNSLLTKYEQQERAAWDNLPISGLEFKMFIFRRSANSRIYFEAKKNCSSAEYWCE